MYDLGMRPDGRHYQYDDVTDALLVSAAGGSSTFPINTGAPYTKAELVAQCQAAPSNVLIGQNAAGGYDLSAPGIHYGCFGPMPMSMPAPAEETHTIIFPDGVKVVLRRGPSTSGTVTTMEVFGADAALRGQASLFCG